MDQGPMMPGSAPRKPRTLRRGVLLALPVLAALLFLGDARRFCAPSSNHGDDSSAPIAPQPKTAVTVQPWRDAAGLSWAGLSHDFGPITEGEQPEVSFRFENRTERQVRIFQVKAACACTGTLVSKTKLAPGESGAVHVRYDSTAAFGAVVKTLQVQTDDPGERVAVLSVHAFVRARRQPRLLAAISPSAARLAYGTPLPATLHLANVGQAPLTISRAIDGDRGVFGSEDIALQVGDQARRPWILEPGEAGALALVLTPEPHDAAPRLLGRLRAILDTNDPLAPRGVVLQEVPFAVPAAPALSLNHERWNFGRARPGQTLAHRFLALNSGEAPLTLTPGTASGASLGASGDFSAIPPHEMREFEATWRAGAEPGAWRAAARFDTDDPLRPTLELVAEAWIDPATAGDGAAGAPNAPWTAALTLERPSIEILLPPGEPGAPQELRGELINGTDRELALSTTAFPSPWSIVPHSGILAPGAGLPLRMAGIVPRVSGPFSRDWGLSATDPHTPAFTVRLTGFALPDPSPALKLWPTEVALPRPGAEASVYLQALGDREVALRTPIVSPLESLFVAAPSMLRGDAPAQVIIRALRPGRALYATVSLANDQAQHPAPTVTAVFAPRSQDAPRPPQHLELLVGADEQGELIGCACAEDSHGGMERLAALWKARAREKPLGLNLHLGNLTGKPEVGGRERLRYAVDAMNAGGCDAALPGVGELGLDEGELRELLARARFPWLLANRHPGWDLPVSPSTLIERQGLTIGVVGVTCPTSGVPSGRLVEPEAALRRELATVRAAADLIVVMASAPDLNHAQELMRKASGVDIWLFAGFSSSVPEIPAASFTRAFLVPSPDATTRRLSFWIDAADGIRAAVSQRVPLTREIEPLPEAVEALNAYRERVATRVTGADAGLNLAQSLFAGPDACRDCHEEAWTTWKAGAHAESLRSLEKQRAHQDPACLPCHVTAWARPGGFSGAGGPLGAVSCEACHGPARAHAQAPEHSPRAALGKASACEDCHTRTRSPAFFRDTQWARIRH